MDAAKDTGVVSLLRSKGHSTQRRSHSSGCLHASLLAPRSPSALGLSPKLVLTLAADLGSHVFSSSNGEILNILLGYRQNIDYESPVTISCNR